MSGYFATVRVQQDDEVALVRLDVEGAVGTFWLTDANGSVTSWTVPVEPDDHEFLDVAGAVLFDYLYDCREKGWTGSVHLVHLAYGLPVEVVSLALVNFNHLWLGERPANAILQ
jgi:hypothetical protein